MAIKKTVIKPARSKTAKKQKPEPEILDQEIQGETFQTSQFPKELQSKNSRSKLVILGLIIIFLALLYYFKGVFIAATVNGEPIYRYTVVSELEKQAGKQALNSVVTKALILQESRKKKITVSNDEVNAEIKKIDASLTKQGQNLDQALLFQGITKQDFLEQVRLQKTAEKLVSSQVKVTDKDIDQYIEQNKELLSQNASSKDTREQVAEKLRQQQISTKLQALIQNLQKNAKINYFVSY